MHFAHFKREITFGQIEHWSKRFDFDYKHNKNYVITYFNELNYNKWEVINQCKTSY